MSSKDRQSETNGRSVRAATGNESRSASPSRGYRRKWKRVAPERRDTAAGSLADVFARRRLGRILWITLIVSLAAHAAVLPAVGLGGAGGEAADLTAAEDNYIQKVMQADRAKRVSKEIKGKITMPPPPAAPETVIGETLSETITGDIGKILATVADVKLANKLAGEVKISMADELAAAAATIASGALSEAEIAALHRRFQEEAHGLAVDALTKHRIETQVERATMSCTQWYENEVSPALMNNMRREMFYLPHDGSVWVRFYRGIKGTTYGQWGFVGISRLERPVALLKALAIGQISDYQGKLGGKVLQHGIAELPDWPDASARQGQAVADVLAGLHREWQDSLPHHLDEYFPHQRDQAGKLAAEADAAWQAAFAAAEACREQAAAGGDAAALKPAQQKALAAVKALGDSAGKLLPDGRFDRDARAINQAVRSQILRSPLRDEQYKVMIDQLVGGLDPMVRDFARGQFKAGIIVHKDGVEQAMKEFPSTIVPLLRRDMERMYPKEEFDRRVFEMPYMNPYRSMVTGENGPPSEEDIAADEKALAEVLARSPELKEYAGARRKVLEGHFTDGIGRVFEELLTRTLAGNLILRNMGTFVEGVDYADKVKERLDARAMALTGRGQDLASLTAEGVPDTSAPLVALMFGASKGHGANLEPVQTTMFPAFFRDGSPQAAVMPAAALYPRAALKWGFETQPDVRAKFETARFEGIPFLPQFPNMDGELSDWGKIRPLILNRSAGEPIVVLAAWNYQGFFFGYRVYQPEESFYWPSQYRAHGAHDYYAIVTDKVAGLDWAYRGDYFRLLFDTLDARRPNRGEPHAQEFVIFPRGTDSMADTPGIERVIASQRDAANKQWRGIKSTCKPFNLQPPATHGPDGTGPYRVTRAITTGPADQQGYVTEAFIPRTLFNVPIFCPGWNIGFDCAVATGAQGRFKGQVWASESGAGQGLNGGNDPSLWGDLLLLGTDPKLFVQNADSAGAIARCIVPGHSYLLTVIDPDRNVTLSRKDTVLVSAEVNAPGGDVEVYILEETEPNSSVFRGYVNTQPGAGRAVQGLLEVLPLQTVRLGYVDIADARGNRNAVFEIKLPVAAAVTNLASVGK